jgi:hypothetical protein
MATVPIHGGLWDKGINANLLWQQPPVSVLPSLPPAITGKKNCPPV